MKFIQTKINDLFIIEPEPFQDDRGKFSRIFCKRELKEINHVKEIVQINHSLTKKKGAIRGLHYQKPPMAEVKMIKCINGSVFDVAVDIRRNSNTFLQWHGEILSAENMKMIYIPEGFAHGFQALEENSELLYFHTEYYTPDHESGLNFNDSKLNIKWPLSAAEISDKDKKLPFVENFFYGVEM